MAGPQPQGFTYQNIGFKPEILQRLDKIARQKGISRSLLIRLYVRKGLKEEFGLQEADSEEKGPL